MDSTIDQYIKNLDGDLQEICSELQQIVSRAIPDVEERMKHIAVHTLADINEPRIVRLLQTVSSTPVEH